MRNRKLLAIVLAALLIVGLGSAYLFRAQIRAAIDTVSGVDYVGAGNGEVVIVV
jgi:hypothetical protein